MAKARSLPHIYWLATKELIGVTDEDLQSHAVRLTTSAQEVTPTQLATAPPDVQPTEPFEIPTPAEIIELGPLPECAAQLIGRENNLAQLHGDLINDEMRISTVVGFGGVGKSSLVSTWWERYSRRPDPQIRRIIIHSFYKQGFAEGSLSSEDFLNRVLEHCKDAEPRSGSLSQKGERLASILRTCKSLVILDGLETLQERTGENKARIRDPGMLSLLRNLSLSNPGLVIITSRLPLTDLRPNQGGPVIERTLEGIWPKDGAKLLDSLGVRGSQRELERASREMQGHCLGLQLLGSYLRDVHGGNVLARSYLNLLGRQTPATEKARRVMRAYSTHLNPAELALMRLVSLFDRPSEPAAVDAIMASKPVRGFTTSLPGPSSEEWRMATHRLRAAHLLNDSHDGDPASLDCHPLLREYFAQDFKAALPSAWAAAHRILAKYFAGDAPRFPETEPQMDRLLRAIAHACSTQEEKTVRNAFRTLYAERAMRQDEDFAVNNLGMLGRVVSALSHFFNEAKWAKPTQLLSRADRINLLTEAGRHLTALKGYAVRDVGDCYGAGLSILRRDTEAEQRFDLLLGLCRHFRLRGQLRRSAGICRQLRQLCDKISTEAATKATERAFAANFFYNVKFDLCEKHARAGDIPLRNRMQGLKEAHRDLNDPGLSCRGYRALALWMLGKTGDAHTLSREVKADTLDLGHGHTTAIILLITAMVAQFGLDHKGVHQEAGELYDLTTDKGYFIWGIAAQILKAWAAANEDPSPTSYLEEIRQYRWEWTQNEARLFLPYWYGLAAEVALRAKQPDDALEEIDAGLYAAEQNGEHWWDAELYRLKALAAAQTNSSRAAITFHISAAITTAQKQDAKSLLRRVQETAAKFSIRLATSVAGATERPPKKPTGTAQTNIAQDPGTGKPTSSI
jgi:hypothetical protein